MAFRVLDSSAFYAGIPFSSNEPSYITPLVYNEIDHIKKDHDAIHILIETKRLTVNEPEDKFVTAASDAAKKLLPELKHYFLHLSWAILMIWMLFLIYVIDIESCLYPIIVIV